MSPTHLEFSAAPLAYLITFNTYGTWLHGDRRGSVDSNHVHTVVSASCKSKEVRAALKARATKNMREQGCWRHEYSPWADQGSRRNLWTHQEVINATVYVEYEQGE